MRCFKFCFPVVVILITLNNISVAQSRKVNDSSASVETNTYKMDSLTKAFLSDSIPVTTHASFTLGKNGLLKDIKILSVECQGCDATKIEHFKKETEKYLLQSKAWTPGKDRKGRPTEVHFAVPVRFALK